MSNALQRILYVEDEADIRQVVELALEAMGGFTVEICSSGAEAIQRGAMFAPDLILLDVMMPQMDGPTTLQRLREFLTLANTPVVFMTAKVQPDEIAYFKSLGALDVIAKPFDPLQLVQTLHAIWNANLPAVVPAPVVATPADRFAARMALLTEQFQHELPERLRVLREQWMQLNQHWDQEILGALHRGVHNLAGSGATFGYDDITKHARALDQQLKVLLHTQVSPSVDFLAQLTQLFKNFEVAVRAVLMTLGVPAAAEKIAEPGKTAEPQPLVYLISADNAARALIGELNNFRYRVELRADVPALATALAQDDDPVAVIFDLRGAAADAALLHCASELRLRDIPVLALAARGDFDIRLRAVRSGVSGFFTWPLDVLALVERLDQQTGQQPREPYRVLLVDADVAAGQRYTEWLTESGMVVETVVHADAVLAQMQKFIPDLLMINIEMPAVSGIEIGLIVRQQSNFDSMPIVFLGAVRGVDAKLVALGLDDFLVTPIASDYFISAVLSRAQRARALRAAMMRDSLTGLLNRTNIRLSLEKEFIRSRRAGTELAILLLDVDFLNTINEYYGQRIGDQLLRALAQLALQRLRKSDYVGRYSGDKFLLILPESSAAAASVIGEQLRAAFARLQLHSEQGDVATTFSAGIAQAQLCNDTAALLSIAERALATAKASGRDRVVISPE